MRHIPALVLCAALSLALNACAQPAQTPGAAGTPQAQRRGNARGDHRLRP